MRENTSAIRKHAGMIALIALLFGVGLLYLGHSLKESTLSYLTTELGIVFVSVVVVSFLYEKYLAEEHFADFREQVNDLLTKQSTVQGTCTRLGITDIFESRNKYQDAHPIERLFGEVRPGGRILVVGRTMLHLFTKLDAIKTALLRGAHIQVAMVGSANFDKVLGQVCSLTVDQLVNPLTRITELIPWVAANKPTGTLEVSTFVNPLPDSLLLIQMADSELIVWDLTFGLDLNDKRVFLLDPCGKNLGRQLLERYNALWEKADPCLRTTAGGGIELNQITNVLRALWNAEPGGSPYSSPAAGSESSDR